MPRTFIRLRLHQLEVGGQPDLVLEGHTAAGKLHVPGHPEVGPVDDGLQRDPEAVIDRAREILATLERKERDLVEETRGHAPSHQLSLFDSRERDVIDALRILQPEAMTPIQALNELQRLKEKLEK